MKCPEGPLRHRLLDNSCPYFMSNMWVPGHQSPTIKRCRSLLWAGLGGNASRPGRSPKPYPGIRPMKTANCALGTSVSWIRMEVRLDHFGDGRPPCPGGASGFFLSAGRPNSYATTGLSFIARPCREQATSVFRLAAIAATFLSPEPGCKFWVCCLLAST